MFRQQVQHAVDRAMRAVASRILLDAEPVLDDCPVLPESAVAAAIGIALGRDGTEEPLRMLQRVGVGGKADLRQARGDDAGMGCLASMERLRHRAEIRHDPGALRSTQRDRCRHAGGIQLAQLGTCRCSADGAKDARRMPALLMVHRHVAPYQFGPGLVARDIGHDHVLAAGAKHLGFRQDSRHQHGGGMAAQGHVIIVERVRRGAVDPAGLGPEARFATEIECRRPARS
jgi:hypothetical protein